MPTRARILFVDPDPSDLATLTALLRADHRLATTDSVSAVDKARGFQPDLIVIGGDRPGVDALATCRELRGAPEGSRAKLVLVSNGADLGRRLAAYDAGIDDWVTRPFDSREVLCRVRVLLRLRSADEIHQLRQDLLSLFQHETRTPLAILLGSVDLARDHPDPEQLASTLDVIHTSARRLAALHDRITILTTLRSDPDSVQVARVQLLDHLQSAVELRRARAQERGIELRSRLRSTMEVQFDVRHVDAVFGELLDNALRFTPAGGRVTIEDLDLPDRMIVRIVDNGSGIAPSRLGQLGGAFTVSSLSHHHAGQGLGLAIAHQIVRMGGGTLRLDSDLGQGTAVSVTLAGADTVEFPDRAAA